MKRIVSILAAGIIATASFAAGNTTTANETQVKAVRLAGPFSIKNPLIIDSISASQKKFSADNLISTPLSLSAADSSKPTDLKSLRLKKGTLNLATFNVTTHTYTKLSATVKGAKNYKVYANGQEVQGEAALQPGQHQFAVKFIADSTGIDITLKQAANDKSAATNGTAQQKAITVGTASDREFSMRENLGTRVIRSTLLSPSGEWALVTYSWFDEQNKTQQVTELCNLKTGRHSVVDDADGWMPLTDRYYLTESIGGKTRLITVSPETGERKTLVSDLPEKRFFFAPSEDYLILQSRDKGPKKEDGVFEILSMDDRQPGWRDRGTISKYDIKTGFTQPLTYGYNNCYTSDITMDGRYMLLSVHKDSLLHRPTSRSTYLRMDMQTLSVDTIIREDGFIGGAWFAKDSNQIIFKATPEAFGGIANHVPEGMTPSMYDYHLYLYDIKRKAVTPLTADDPTSIEDVRVSPVDGMVYYTAERADSVLLFRIDLSRVKANAQGYGCYAVSEKLGAIGGIEVLNGFDIASRGGNIIVYGSSPCTPYQAYTFNPAATGKKQAAGKKSSAANAAVNATLVLDPNADFYAGVRLGTVKAWQFRCSRGYDVSGFYYLPADFDAKKKYPVIVDYYGGCSPTSRRFGGGSHYPAHYWNALGYIVFVVNPSGASGFGQEWAARHVNTMGEGPAQDIIDATRQFAKDVPQVDADHIGCVSASYGGFMTQYMLTKDNPFACGISHAGISSHTSYWGEGYWGYNYSEVSAANSYPWTRKDLFVDRSPLYNADKIKKPLLFTHGTADTNVPIGESIQMYTALRLLGTPTAFIQVEGENHGIMDPVKRTKWINSMAAWFQRWLQGDDSWWNAIYTPKNL